MEVWYDTITDAATGTGLWLHHELISPTDGSDAYLHGWAAVFPSDGTPQWERFGPAPAGDGPWFEALDVVAEPGVRRGSAGDLSWDLRYRDASPPVFTFPRWTWRRAVLPAAQVVPSPVATWEGTVRVGDQQVELEDARGSAARIYGHGNAQRWGWLHADLGGGDVLEIVAAVPRRPVLDRFRPLPLVQIRTDGKVWPGNPLIAALRLRARLGLPTWTVEGRWRGHHLRVEVTQPAEACVEVPYTDPDGATATCTNSERASAHVVFDDLEWHLDGTAHAEIGSRP